MMNEIQLSRIDLNLLVVFEALMETRSVTDAAARLGKTPSAISHALGRMRTQLDDPLMVKVGGRMQPSPFALRLQEDLRPILRGIERAVAPPVRFEPARSTRTFRVVIPSWPPLMARIYARMQREAPQVVLEWLGPREDAALRLADGQIDLAVLGEATVAPDGVRLEQLPEIRIYCFARAGHPAIPVWSRAAWLRYPHLMVALGSKGPNRLDLRVAEAQMTRRIGARIPDFGAIAPILARTDYLCNGFGLSLMGLIEPFDLQVLQPPFEALTGTVALLWNARLERDPELAWLRATIRDCVAELSAESEAAFAAREILLPRDVREDGSGPGL